MLTKLEKVASIYSIFMGISMIGMWIMFYATGSIPELESKPIEIAMHLLAEFATAILLIVGGIGLLQVKKWRYQIYFVSIGMLLYTLPNSSGYFMESREYGLVIMFGVFLFATLALLINMVKVANSNYKNHSGEI